LRNGDWDYERGRLFGRIALLNTPLRIGKKLNSKASRFASSLSIGS